MSNDYLEVLDFLEAHAGDHYMAPERAQTQDIGDEFRVLGEGASTALDKMYTLCEDCASRINHHLITTNRKNWLRGDNRAIRDYFWVQLKHKDYQNRPISISIFAESCQQESPYFYRLALELEEKKASPDDYRVYKRGSVHKSSQKLETQHQQTLPRVILESTCLNVSSPRVLPIVSILDNVG
ncbi:MAG: hypothetical protein IJ165_12130, partial [Proteobacteria bacterium]|nr:hypothetical protein [Pseudomonadota bacterium]